MCVWHDIQSSCLVTEAYRLASLGLVCTCHGKLAVKLYCRLFKYFCKQPQFHTSNVFYVKVPHYKPSHFSSLSLHPSLSSSILLFFPISFAPLSLSLPDYLSSSVPSSITFGFNDCQMCFDITISEDIVAELTEYFYLYITNTTPFDVRIVGKRSIITILDNDGKATICCIHVFSPPPASFSQGASVWSLLGHI